MFYDCHTHSCYSHDAPNKTPRQGCKAAYKKGLLGVAYTEHMDLRFNDRNHCIEYTEQCIKEVAQLKKEYEGKMKVFIGTEIADACHSRQLLDKALGLCDYDSVLCSVHLINFRGEYFEISTADLNAYSDSELHEMLSIYYEYMRKSLYETDFNILCHLTYPLRYMNKKFGRNLSLDSYQPLIEDIFKIAIDKNTALEINTSKCTLDDPDFCPEEYYIKLYKSLGGTLFTLGSDSHVAGNEGNMFTEAAQMLKNLGIDKCCYFENRKHYFYSI